MTSSSSGVVDLNFVSIGQKGKKKLVRGGYQYYFQSKNLRGTQIWRCSNKGVRCNASVTLNSALNTVIRESTTHTCKPNFSKNKIALAVDTLKEHCRTEWKPIPELYEECMKGLDSDSDSSENSEPPPFSSVKDACYAARKAVLNNSKLKFKNVQEVKFPEILTNKFLLYEGEGEDKIFIFGSPGCMKLIKKNDLYLADGTFKSVPNPFEQLFTVHVDIGSTREVTTIIPIFFCLLPNKKESTYTEVFRILKEKFQVSISFFKSDWETAIMNAVKTVYPDVKIKGCFFHFSNAIWKNAEKFEMTLDKQHRRIVRLTTNLALLPVEYVPEGWLFIMNEAPDDTATANFVAYFQKQWMGKICANMWCCSQERHRTTNALEGWHYRLNIKIGKANLFSYVKFLKKEATFYAKRIKNNKVYTEPRKRRSKFIIKDAKISGYIEDLIKGKITPEECLKDLCRFK
ncbi:hypothetical protein ABMA28_005362 [Loxostege sticticalis]|uniref:MULE transposase domain-containing protein n=1 Tax=Loxostege sticticalis TaxID=481309 RepID=A0ABD0SQ62_LOXSC